ncbi:MAG TPA: substrate-binding domain-containing protein [Pirellulales bacterium]|jgi:ribose transport system substrate-binding protein|nr:substrate-binding domain-containing protein [Pirellulales bacterium]
MLHNLSIIRRFALLLVSSILLAGCTKSPQDVKSAGLKRLILLNNNDSPYWNTARAGIRAADEKLHLADSGLTAVMEINGAGTDEGQIAKLRQFGSQSDVAGVAISPTHADNAAIMDELKNLRAKGIPVICVDSDVDRDKYRDARSYYVGTDNATGGEVLAMAAKNLLPQGGEYVQFVGSTGAQNAKDRMDAFSKTLGDKFVEKGRMADETDKTKAKTNVIDAIRNNPKLAMVVGIWSYNGPAIVDAIKEMNKTGLTVVAFDAQKDAIALASEGNIHAMVVQNPYEMGFQSIRLLKAMVDKDDKTIKEMLPHADQKDGDIYDTGLRVVAPDNSPLKREMFGGKAEFYTFPDFKKWLAERNLESS